MIEEQFFEMLQHAKSKKCLPWKLGSQISIGSGSDIGPSTPSPVSEKSGSSGPSEVSDTMLSFADLACFTPCSLHGHRSDGDICNAEPVRRSSFLGRPCASTSNSRTAGSIRPEFVFCRPSSIKTSLGPDSSTPNAWPLPEARFAAATSRDDPPREKALLLQLILVVAAFSVMSPAAAASLRAWYLAGMEMRFACSI